MKDQTPQPPRVCVCCNCEAPSKRKKLAPGLPSILSLNMTIYRRTRSGRQQQAARAVTVCETCLQSVWEGFAPWANPDTEKVLALAEQLINSAHDRYNAMKQEKNG